MEQLLRVIADGSGQAQGLPVWAQIVVPLIVASVALAVGALGRSHDRDMRLKDDIRTELVRALGHLSDANEALREASFSSWKIDSFQELLDLQKEHEQTHDTSGLKALIQEREEELRSIAGAHADAFARMERQGEILSLLCPEGSPVLEGFAQLIVQHQVAKWFTIELVPPLLTETDGEDSVGARLKKRLESRITVIERLTKEFGATARSYVQPEPSLWQQTALPAI